MFGDKKIKPEKVDLTLSELIEKYVEKYVDRNYVNVDYKANGSVSIWISLDRNYVNVDYKANGPVSIWISPKNKEKSEDKE